MKRFLNQMRVSPLSKKEEGIALVIALLILVMLTVVGLVAIISSSTETAIATNAKGSTQALYLAEAGVAQVSWWFMQPSSFTIAGHFPNNYTGAATNFFAERMQDSTSYFVSGFGGTTQFNGPYTTPDFRLDKAYDADADTILNDPGSGVFRNLSTYGSITELRVFRPSAGSNNICTVRVTAESKLGGRRTIEQELSPNPIPGLTAPLQSGLGASWNGNGTIHWGDVIVQGNASLQNNINQVKYQYNNAQLNTNSTNNVDRWFNVKLSGQFLDNQGDPIGAGPTPYSAMHDTAPDGTEVYHTNLMQQQSVQIQKWDYNTMKTFAMQNGYYYYADASGNVYDAGGTPVTNWISQNNGFVFIDTPNKTDPAAGGSSFTINISGATQMNGAFYIAGNVDFGGLGQGNPITAKAPPNPTDQVRETMSDQLNANIKGVVYTTGTMDFSGGPTVFGALVAERGFGSHGSPDIWYDWDIRKGRYGNLVPTTRKVWREVRDQNL